MHSCKCAGRFHLAKKCTNRELSTLYTYCTLIAAVMLIRISTQTSTRYLTTSSRSETFGFSSHPRHWAPFSCILVNDPNKRRRPSDASTEAGQVRLVVIVRIIRALFASRSICALAQRSCLRSAGKIRQWFTNDSYTIHRTLYPAALQSP